MSANSKIELTNNYLQMKGKINLIISITLVIFSLLITIINPL